MSFKICARNAKYSLVVEREWKLVVYSAVFLRLATPKLNTRRREIMQSRSNFRIRGAYARSILLFQRNFLTYVINFPPVLP